MNMRLVLGIALLLCCQNVAFAAESEVDSSVAYTSNRILTLLEKASDSLNSNPNFYIEDMGFVPFVDLAKWLRSDGRMKVFETISMDEEWTALNPFEKNEFESLVNEGRRVTGYDVTESIGEIWKAARMNSDLQVACCGGACNFDLKFISNGEVSGVHISLYESGKYCTLKLTLPHSDFDKLTPEYTKKSYLPIMDSRCNGDLEWASFGDGKADIKIIEYYEKIVRALNPIQTYARSRKVQCDL